MKSSAWIAAITLAVLAALGAGAYLSWRAVERAGVAQGVAKAAQEMDQARAEAKATRPDEPVSQAVTEAYSRKLEDRLAAVANDRGRQAEMAANNFVGFLNSNAKVRGEYCREMGVDISAFTAAMLRDHAAEVARAREIHAKRGIEVEPILEALKAQSRKNIEIDMQDVARSTSRNMPDACRLFAEKGPELARALHVSRVHPALHQALMR